MILWVCGSYSGLGQPHSPICITAGLLAAGWSTMASFPGSGGGRLPARSWDVWLGSLLLLRVAGSSGRLAQVFSLGGSEFQALKHKVFSSFCLHQDKCISSASLMKRMEKQDQLLMVPCLQSTQAEWYAARTVTSHPAAPTQA